MDNIPKITDIHNGMQDSSGRPIDKGKKKERASDETVRSFEDIYDVRLKSAEFNRDSAGFKGVLLQEAGVNLNTVIASLDKLNAETIINRMPSEEIINLSKLVRKNYS